MHSYTVRFLQGTQEIASSLNQDCLERMIDMLIEIRSREGRVFFLELAAEQGMPATQ